MAKYVRHVTKPEVSSKTLLDRLLSAWKVVDVCHVAGWYTSHVGTGASGASPLEVYINTGANPNSRGLIFDQGCFLNSGTLTVYTCDYTKRLELHFILERTGNDAQAVARVQLKQTSAEGDLAAVGLGLRINNYTVLGEAYGTVRKTVALGVLADRSLWRVKIVFVPGDRVEFWVNGVLTGTLTGTAVPVAVTAMTYIVISIINGAAGGVACYLEMGNIRFIQEW